MTDLRGHLLAVRDEFGELTPANVVESARADDSPLHDRFEWDDSVAGERYRQSQASQLIRTVRVDFVSASGPGFVRGFVSVQSEGDEGGRVYRPVEEVVAHPVARELVLREFEREWRVFKARYEHLAEFADLILSSVAREAA